MFKLGSFADGEWRAHNLTRRQLGTVAEADTLYLLPVKGSDTEWYKNVLAKPTIRIDARGAEAELAARAITERKQVASVVEKFREKYGASDVKKYYSKFDVAVFADIT